MRDTLAAHDPATLTPLLRHAPTHLPLGPRTNRPAADTSARPGNVDKVAAAAGLITRAALQQIIARRRPHHQALTRLLADFDLADATFRAARGADADRHFRDLLVARWNALPTMAALRAADEFLPLVGVGERSVGDGHVLQLVAQTGHQGAVASIAFDGAGTRFITVGDDGRVISWDAETGYELHTLWRDDAHLTAVTLAALSPDGREMLVVGDNHLVLHEPLRRSTNPHWLRASCAAALAAGVWVLVDARITLHPSGDAFGDAAVFSAISPRGDLVLRVGADGEAVLWGVEARKALATLQGQRSGVRAAALSADGARAVTLDAEGVATLWDARSGASTGRLSLDADVSALSLSHDGGVLAATSPRGVRVFRVAGASPGPMRDVARALDGIDAITCAALSPAAAHPTLVVGTRSGALHALSCERGDVLWRVSPRALSTTRITFSDDERTCELAQASGAVHTWRPERREVTVTPADRVDRAGHVDALRVDDAPFGQVLRRADNGDVVGCYLSRGSALRRVELTPDTARMMLQHDDGLIHVMDTRRRGHEWLQTPKSVFGLRVPRCSAAGLSPTGRYFAGASHGGPVDLWHVDHNRPLCTLLSFDDGAWVVTDNELRFDYAPHRDLSRARWLHWVLDVEPIELAQLKRRFYDPFLLAKRLRLHAEPLRRVSSAIPRLPPLVRARFDAATREARVEVVERDGGLGTITVAVDRKRVLQGRVVEDRDGRVRLRFGDRVVDATVVGGEGAHRRTLTFSLPLTEGVSLRYGAASNLTVTTTDDGDALKSREVSVEVPASTAPTRAGAFRAVVAGISRYADSGLDLTFSANDARGISAALAAVSASGFTGSTITTLHTDGDDAPLPTRPAIIAALEQARGAAPEDTFVLYLSGHGAQVRDGDDEDFYYLTQESMSGDVDDPAMRGATTLSSRELIEHLAAIPAHNQFVVLDTCHAGQLALDIEDRAETGSTTTATLEAVTDEAGPIVLAAAAADTVSWESNRYGQGLLTYAMLFGLRGPALRDDGAAQVLTLCTYAQEMVPTLAAGGSGTQTPIYAVPGGSAGFSLGSLAPERRREVPLALPLPVVVRSSFHDDDDIDPLNLGGLVDNALQAAGRGADARLFFVDERMYPNACQFVGRYTEHDNRVTVTAHLYQSRARLASAELTQGIDALTALAQGVLDALAPSLRG